MIKLGASPHHLLSDVGDQHVGADGGCLPGWWFWGNIDSLDHATWIFFWQNGLIWWFCLVMLAGTENTGGSGSAGTTGPILQPLTTVHCGIPATGCWEGGAAQTVLASDTAYGSAAAWGSSGEGDSGNAPEGTAADQGNSAKGQVGRLEAKMMSGAEALLAFCVCVMLLPQNVVTVCSLVCAGFRCRTPVNFCFSLVGKSGSSS